MYDLFFVFNSLYFFIYYNYMGLQQDFWLGQWRRWILQIIFGGKYNFGSEWNFEFKPKRSLWYKWNHCLRVIFHFSFSSLCISFCHNQMHFLDSCKWISNHFLMIQNYMCTITDLCIAYLLTSVGMFPLQYVYQIIFVYIQFIFTYIFQ